MGYCKNCGSEIVDGDTFCRKCGQKINSNTDNTQINDFGGQPYVNSNNNVVTHTPTSQGSNGKFAKIAIGMVCGCVVVSVISVFAILGISNNKNIKQGNEYFKNNDFSSAADCYAKVNKLSGNYSYYRNLIDEIDQSSDTYSQAKSAVDDKDYITALTISQNAIKDYPHMTVFLDIITEAEDGLSSDITTLYNSGNYAEAYKDINALDESLVNSDIENIKNLILGTIDGKINSAQSSFDSGDYTTAEAAANYVLDIEPDNETAKSIIASISAKRSAKETYISKLKNTIQGIGCSYSIYDINKDGISDVVFRTQADTTPGQKTATFALYVYENGNFNKIGSVSTDGNDLYASKKNGVYVISSDPCWEEYIKYEYRNGSLVRNQSEEVFVGIETFSVDGKPASKQVAENNARIIEGNAMTFTASSNLSAADSATFTE